MEVYVGWKEQGCCAVLPTYTTGEAKRRDGNGGLVGQANGTASICLSPRNSSADTENH